MRRRRLLCALVTMLLLTVAAAAMASSTRHPLARRSATITILGPAQFDLTLAEVRLAGARTRGTPRVALRGATGLDYVVAGAIARARAPSGRVLVLVINRRPRGSLAPDLARVSLRMSPSRAGATATVLQVVDPLTRPGRAGSTPTLCDLPPRSAPLRASDARTMLGAGSALPGFSAAAALAAAYNVVCGRAPEQSFRAAVSGPASPPTPTPTPTPPPCSGPQCTPPPCGCCGCCGGQACPAGARGTSADRMVACPKRGTPVACPL